MLYFFNGSVRRFLAGIHFWDCFFVYDVPTFICTPKLGSRVHQYKHGKNPLGDVGKNYTLPGLEHYLTDLTSVSIKKRLNHLCLLDQPLVLWRENCL